MTAALLSASAAQAGDAPAIKALHVPAPVIIDEVAPHLWTGPKALESWLADLAKSETADGESGGQVTPVTNKAASGWKVAAWTWTGKAGARRRYLGGFVPSGWAVI